MNESLSQRDKKYIWHPFTSLAAPEPLPIVKGEGPYLIDEQGNRYLDAISSWWVTIHGHAHPYIAERIYRQALELEQVIFAGFTHRPAIELAEKLIELLPAPFTKIFYSDNGSTATEVAVKMALQYWWNQEASVPGKRNRVIAFNHAYHGDTFGAMSISGRSIFTQAFADKLFDVVFIDTPDENNIGELKETIRKQGDTIAAFIYEPLLQGSGGMRMYSASLMDELLEVCRQQEIICIADEVMTGFGRTGRLFASEYMRQRPDIICLSKGLTGGTMALGVTACNQKIETAFLSEDKLKTFFHGHSFTANPLACTAALASIELLMKKECTDSRNMLSAANTAFLAELHKQPQVRNARCLGTVLAFEIEGGADGYLNTIGKKVTETLLKQGVYVRPLGNTVYIMPPYCVSEIELATIQNALLSFIKGYTSN